MSNPCGSTNSQKQIKVPPNFWLFSNEFLPRTTTSHVCQNSNATTDYVMDTPILSAHILH